jgi:uncharacterized protein (TIGR02996 family)
VAKKSNQEKAFLDAICDDPADVAPRLVFADWLEDHGRAHRDEFIRAQIALTKMPPHADERRPLENREWELLTVYRDEWSKHLPAWAKKEPFAFVRGFVGRMAMTATKFRGESHDPLDLAGNVPRYGKAVAL